MSAVAPSIPQHTERISRADLRSRSSRCSSSEGESETEGGGGDGGGAAAPGEDREAMLHRLTSLFEDPAGELPSSASVGGGAGVPSAGEDGGDAGLGFEFRLFGGKGRGQEAVRVLLPEEGEEEGVKGEGGFVNGGRSEGYYFARGERRTEMEEVAVSGEEVLKGRGLRFWGLEVPWRVVVLRGGEGGEKDGGGMVRGIGEEGVGRKKGKPGKKRRIILRQRRRKVLEAEERRQAAGKKREEEEKDKRTRRNREKKVKRKAREKKKKAEGERADEAGGAISANDSS